MQQSVVISAKYNSVWLLHASGFDPYVLEFLYAFYSQNSFRISLLRARVKYLQLGGLQLWNVTGTVIAVRAAQRFWRIKMCTTPSLSSYDIRNCSSRKHYLSAVSTLHYRKQSYLKIPSDYFIFSLFNFSVFFHFENI